MEPPPISRDDIEHAVGVIAGRLRRTPTLPCEDLGARHFLKAELFQRLFGDDGDQREPAVDGDARLMPRRGYADDGAPQPVAGAAGR